MTGKASRDDEDCVDADVVAGALKTRRQTLRRHHDAAQAMLVERQCGAIVGGALLDLDEGDGAAAPGDQVDLAAWNAGALRENAPALKP